MTDAGVVFVFLTYRHKSVHIREEHVEKDQVRSLILEYLLVSE